MRFFSFAAAAVLAIVLQGCAGTSFSYDNTRKVQVGMTEESIASRAGWLLLS